MKYCCAGILFKLVFVSLALFLPSCISTTPIGMPVREGITVDAGYYTVKSPPGKGWGVQIDKKKGVVKFQKAKWWWTSGQQIGSTQILIYQNGIKQKGWHLAEKEVADDFRNNEERIMIKKGVKTGAYKLIGDIVKDSTTIDRTKLYFMRYVTKLNRVSQTQEAALYLYFPPSFKEKHRFYCFLITEAYRPGRHVKVDLKQIFPVIKSFQIKTSNLPEKMQIKKEE